MRVRFVASLALAAVVANAVPVRAAGDVATLIRRQSQAFSDASASGDAKALDRYLDDAVVFVNENGDTSTKKELVEGAAPPPAGITQTLVQRDFRVSVHGSVAVTSFTDVSTSRIHGQIVHASFRSTEVWLDERGAWKMISSQTIALAADPPAVTLPSAELDEYVGTYRGGPGFDVTIARAGAGITDSVNGGTPLVLKAELRDVFFVAGQPRVRRIFERDASGKVVRFVSRHEGHDIAFERVA